MKTFYVATQPKKSERVDNFISWLVVPVFALGFFAGELWPAHKPSLHVVFYAIGSLLTLRFLVILARIPRQPINYCSLRLSDSGLEYRDRSPEPRTATRIRRSPDPS